MVSCPSKRSRMRFVQCNISVLPTRSGVPETDGTGDRKVVICLGVRFRFCMTLMDFFFDMSKVKTYI